MTNQFSQSSKIRKFKTLITCLQASNFQNSFKAIIVKL